MTMKDEASDEKIRFTPDILHANERDELIDFSQEQFDMLFDVVRLAQASNALGTKVTTIGKTTRATVFSTTRIRAKLPEVKDIFFSEHTHFATGFTQSQQIYTLLTPSNNHPMRSAAVRWSLWDAPSKMVRKRDVVYVEYMDEFEDDNGRRGWARCTHSIEHRSCPPLVNSHNIVRAHMYCSGSIYTETDEPGVLEVITLFDVDTRGIPAWMSKLTALRKAQSATNVEHLIKLSRVMSDEEDPEVKLIEFQVKGKVCRGCGDKISKWSASRKCRECKEPLCKSCSDVVYYKSEERKKIKNICVYCVDEELSDGDMRGDYCGGLDAINENFVHAPRRSNHKSFRSLRLARETNVSISPVYASSRRSSLSYSRSASVASLTTQPPHMNPSMQRRQSDPGMTGSRQSLSRHHTSPTLRSSRSIAV